MRRICMSALVLSALAGSAFAQIAYVPYGATQPVYAAQPQQAPAQQYVYAPQQPLAAPAAAAPGQQYYYVYAQQPRYAAPAPQTVPRYTSSRAGSYAAAAPAYTGSRGTPSRSRQRRPSRLRRRPLP